MYDRATAEGVMYNYGYGGENDKIESEYLSTKSALVFSPQVDFEYLRHPKFKLSSGLAVGYAISHASNTAYGNFSSSAEGLTFHLNLISFRWGKKSGLMGYLGLGYKGALGLGYFVRF